MENMIVTIKISWDPSTSFEESKLINLHIISEEGSDKTEYKGYLKKAKVVMDYIRSLYYNFTDETQQKENFFGEEIENDNKKGIKTYKIEVTNLSEDFLKRHGRQRMKDIQEKFFLVTRNEWVNYEEYCVFFGSSCGCWNPEDCDYKMGDFAEEIRQTIYDMENGRPTIYTWTNAPSMFILMDLMERDEKFSSFAKKEIVPLMEQWKDMIGKKPETKEITLLFSKIADAAEKYKKENNFELI